ncbi:MAG: hypothetical protein EOO10_14205 [Chitinophagaceae bacterium]|nr:MAG: hypothetical protein EOO10_14205 [Chitinophagaceae bacterium]
MKVFNLSWLGVLALFTFGFFACQKESSLNKELSEKTTALAPGAAAKASPKSMSSFGDYSIAVTMSPDGKTWTYNITRAKQNAKNLSHLIINLNNCGEESATFANIVSATVNGAPADLKPTEGGGTGCDPQETTNNFVKINFSEANSWLLVITFDRGYNAEESALGWVKAGTSCNTGTIKAPGCPLTSYCSFSQGYFFANGALNNGASSYWTSGLTIGGTTYTQAQGMNFWSIDKGKGGDQTMNAFFQLGAVRLSSNEGSVGDDAAIIEAYFTGMDLNNKIATGNNPNGSTYQYFNLPVTNNNITKEAAIAAGSRIGEYIAANHCAK